MSDTRPAHSDLLAYVEQALAAGIVESSLLGMLTAAGWTEREVFEALVEYHELATGIRLPRRRTASATSAKDAFFYLVIFASLATCTFAAGCMAFTLLDRWLPDPLFAGDYHQTFASSAITSSLAAMLVAFPIFLLVSRSVLGDAATSVEKRESSVRKWLTYMALVIAACVMMGDLITAITYLLRGELTSRFLAKALVVLLLSGGTFFFYFGGLLPSAESKDPPARNKLMAGLSSALVVVLVILGFTQLGSPGKQRELRADLQREWAIYHVAVDISNYAQTHDHMPPPDLAQLIHPDPDPVSKQPFEYHAGPGAQYQLCDVFTSASEPSTANRAEQLWQHTSGHSCFHFQTNSSGLFPPPIPADD